MIHLKMYKTCEEVRDDSVVSQGDGRERGEKSLDSGYLMDVVYETIRGLLQSLSI